MQQTPFGSLLSLSLSLPPPSALRPPLCPFVVLTPARIRTVGGCYTVIYIHTSTAYIASHADDCVAFVYVRTRVQVGMAVSRSGSGWLVHAYYNIARAGWRRWADAQCTGCRDLSRFSVHALAKMTLLGGLYLEKNTGHRRARWGVRAGFYFARFMNNGWRRRGGSRAHNLLCVLMRL